MNRWYVLQVITGKELAVRDRLAALDIPARVPREIIKERRHGIWRARERVILPGYVFAQLLLDTRVYYRTVALPGVIRFPGTGGGIEPLPEHEAEIWISMFPEDEPLGVSDICMEGDAVDVVCGPLAGLSGRILSVHRRQRRARVELPVLGQTRVVTLSVNILRKN